MADKLLDILEPSLQNSSSLHDFDPTFSNDNNPRAIDSKETIPP